MKVLVAAYACNPHGGSEPGVGWAAVALIARHHDVWVLTHAHNRRGWEGAERDGAIPKNVRVRYLGDTGECSENRFFAHLQSWKNYHRFMRVVLVAARQWHEEVGFDLCHQVTIASWRMPSPLWRLPIPLVWGPIGGAGYIPKAFRGMLSVKARVFEFMRDLQTWYALRSVKFRKCIRHTAVVLAANQETAELLLAERRELPMLRQPIVSVTWEKAQKYRAGSVGRKHSSVLQLFAGGNMEGRKGVGIALRALAYARDAGVDFLYTVAGGGPEISDLRLLCGKLGLAEKVCFHPGYAGNDYVKALQESDVYFLPSFRESTPVTLIEAYLAGCYPLVADTGAQGEIVRAVGGSAVAGSTPEELACELAAKLQELAAGDPRGLAEHAGYHDKVREMFSVERYAKTISEAYRIAVKGTIV